MFESGTAELPEGLPQPAAPAVLPKPAVATVGMSTAPKVVAALPVAPPFQIQTLTDSDRWIKLLVYGGYGSGKTRLCGTAAAVPYMRDVLFVNCEAGDLTIMTEEDALSAEDKKHIDVIRVSSYKTLARVHEFLKAHCMFRDMPFEEGEPKLKQLEAKLFPQADPKAPARRYQTLIMDSITEAETFSMYSLLSITDATRLDEETQAPEWAEYKKNNSQLMRLSRAMRDLPMNLLMTAAASYVQNESKQFIYQPALTGKLAKQIQGFMDVVGFLHVVPGENNTRIHRMLAHPTPRVDAKCRFSNFKRPYWDDPTMRSILESVGLIQQLSQKK